MAGFGYNTGLDGHRIVPLTEEESEEIAHGIKTIYGRASERMLTGTAKRVSRGITIPGWAERKASEVLAAHEQLRFELDRASRKRESLLKDVMARAYAAGNSQFYAHMGAVLGPVRHISPNAMKAGYILADLNNNLNAAERRILRQFDDSYANIIGAASAEMATGVMNTREAVGDALRAFADQGITSFVDRGGHRWTLENYSEMAVLTAIERSTISGYVDTMQSYGYDLAIIDGHAGSCPICAAWEGVIVSVSGDNPDYPSLLDAENDGCFHPRCLHGITTYYPGVSHEPEGGYRSEPREKEEPSQPYTARSKQRYMERMIRKYKDRAIVAQTRLQKAQALEFVKRWEQQLDQLIDDQPEDDYLYRHKEREKGLQSESTGGNISTAASIRRPIEQRNTGKGIPGAIVHLGRPLSNRQQSLLDKLPEFGSRVIVPKNEVNMTDLSALTAHTGQEFAMFTKGGERLIVRGSETNTPIYLKDAVQLREQGYRWSGHTHPGTDDSSLIPSSGDHVILNAFEQSRSEIYNSLGHHAPIWSDE